MKRIVQALGLLAILFTQPVSAAADNTWTDVERVVAFGDIHGDYEQFIALLTNAHLINSRKKWVGGRTHFVQLGDVTDRGPDSRKIVDLIMKLEKEARRAKGEVHFVIGNHEAMNMVGDLRYVHPGEYKAFASSSSARERDRYYRRTIDHIKATTSEDTWPTFDDAFRAAWNVEHPLGYIELRRAWGPQGKFGRWLVKHHAVIRINDAVFAHGGIGPKFVDHSREVLNDQVVIDLKTGTYNPDALITDEQGPLWYRGLAMNSEVEEQPHVSALLASHEVSHIVVGHTPRVGAIYPRFGDEVILIDVGIGAHYGGRSAFLEITDDGMTAWHRGTALPLPADGGQARIDYLKAAAALDPQPSPIESTIRRLETEKPATPDTSE